MSAMTATTSQILARCRFSSRRSSCSGSTLRTVGFLSGIIFRTPKSDASNLRHESSPRQERSARSTVISAAAGAAPVRGAAATTMLRRQADGEVYMTHQDKAEPADARAALTAALA